MYLCGNKTIITDSERVANKFNKYFITRHTTLLTNVVKQKVITKIVLVNIISMNQYSFSIDDLVPGEIKSR